MQRLRNIQSRLNQSIMRLRGFPHSKWYRKKFLREKLQTAVDGRKEGLQCTHEPSLHINPALLSGARSPCHSLLGLGQLHIPASSTAVWQKQCLVSLGYLNVYTEVGQRSPSNKQLMLPQQARNSYCLLPWKEHPRKGDTVLKNFWGQDGNGKEKRLVFNFFLGE